MAGSDPMMPPFPGVKLTYDDFVQFPDDGQRHELIDGEHMDAIRIYRQEGAAFARVVELSASAGDVLTTTLLPGLEIPLSRVLKA